MTAPTVTTIAATARLVIFAADSPYRIPFENRNTRTIAAAIAKRIRMTIVTIRNPRDLDHLDMLSLLNRWQKSAIFDSHLFMDCFASNILGIFPKLISARRLGDMSFNVPTWSLGLLYLSARRLQLAAP